VNLLQFQRQYQASARLISVVDEMTQTLISLI
jgi:flagellar hook-associated protein FlgK